MYPKIWSRSGYILLILSSYFPDGVCEMILQFMFQGEFNDSKEDYKLDCNYFRIQKSIGLNLSKLKPPSETMKHFRFNKELWRNVDYDNKNMHLWVAYRKCIPPEIDQYDELNCDRSSLILQKSKKRSIYDRIIFVDGAMFISNDYTNHTIPQFYDSHYDNETTVVRNNEHIDKNKFEEFMNDDFNYHDWEQWHKEMMKYHHSDQKYMARRKTMKKHHSFKKNYPKKKNNYNLGKRKHGIQTFHRKTNKHI